MPRQLGPYRLVRRLGPGGMAEVFLAAGLRGQRLRELPGTPLALHIADELALALGAVHALTDEEGRPLGVSP